MCVREKGLAKHLSGGNRLLAKKIEGALGNRLAKNNTWQKKGLAKNYICHRK